MHGASTRNLVSESMKVWHLALGFLGIEEVQIRLGLHFKAFKLNSSMDIQNLARVLGFEALVVKSEQ